MAARNPKTSKIIVQNYPRIEDADSKDYGLLDDRELAEHKTRVPLEDLPKLILAAVENANRKSGRAMLNVPSGATEVELVKIYESIGRDLFDYFQQYSSDPASFAFQLRGQSCREVGVQQFRNKALQKERMNSGWRYQYLAIDCAQKTGRFASVSELGLREADFNALVEIRKTHAPLSIYVSAKNRSNTIGGPDWPNAIQALEALAISDRNRRGPYICIFAFLIESGGRSVKRTKDRSLHSPNTELWASDYFWPFFTNYSYEEIMQAVLQVLIANPDAEKVSLEVPSEILDVFERHCRDEGLVDAIGNFNDPAKLVSFFCNTSRVSRKSRNAKKS